MRARMPDVPVSLDHVSEEPKAAWLMSTHAIKTELLSTLQKVRPKKRWPKRVTVGMLCDFAVHEIRADTTNRDEHRVLELARVLYDHERR